MQLQLADLKAKYEALSLRERGLVVLTVVAATWLLWDVTLADYLAKQAVNMERRIGVLRQEIVREVTLQETLQREKAKDPTGKLLQERSALQQQLSGIQGRLNILVGRFVDPRLMPTLLEDILAKHRDLKLLRLSAQPVKPMQIDEQDATTVVPGLYRHGMILEVSGEYFELLNYLQELEQSRWQFIWRRLDYEVAHFPVARVHVELETLSQDRNWLGV